MALAQTLRRAASMVSSADQDDQRGAGLLQGFHILYSGQQEEHKFLGRSVAGWLGHQGPSIDDDNLRLPQEHPRHIGGNGDAQPSVGDPAK
jgi:hypothetical protein